LSAVCPAASCSANEANSSAACIANGTMALVVPTYEKDLCKLRLFARGMARNVHTSLFKSVKLIWTSAEPMAAYAAQLRAVGAEFGPLEPLIEWLEHSSIVAPSNRSFHGWYQQQLAKLTIARTLSTDFYVVLDSKNAPIAKLVLSDFLDPARRAWVHNDFQLTKHRNQSKYATWYGRSENVIGWSVPDCHRVPRSITPITLHTASVKSMLALLERRVKGGLANAIARNGATEFTLYNTYIRGPDLAPPFGCVHAESPVTTDEVAETVFTTGASVESRFDQIRGLAHGHPHKHVRFFGLHKEFVSHPEVHSRIDELLALLLAVGRSHGLLREGDSDELNHFCLSLPSRNESLTASERHRHVVQSTASASPA